MIMCLIHNIDIIENVALRVRGIFRFNIPTYLHNFQ